MDEPTKAFDHCLDALRYAVFTHWGSKRDLKELTNEQREFELWKKQKEAMNPWANKNPHQQIKYIRPR